MILAKNEAADMIVYMVSEKAKSSKKDKNRPAAVNKKAWFNYEIVEKIEAGVSLVGSEIKSLRLGQADLAGSYARIDNQECWLVGANIAAYEQAGDKNHMQSSFLRW